MWIFFSVYVGEKRGKNPKDKMGKEISIRTRKMMKRQRKSGIINWKLKIADCENDGGKNGI